MKLFLKYPTYPCKLSITDDYPGWKRAQPKAEKPVFLSIEIRKFSHFAVKFYITPN